MNPDSKGSSEKYSKFLPHRGCLWILAAGPKITSIPYALASLPIALPTS